MQPPALVGGWRHAVVREVTNPHPMAVILRLEVPDRVDHLPGQHYVVRLTADDGYTASRSYSLSSPPSDPLIEMFVERLDDGEVSGYLADDVRPGDELEVRGPVGRWFVWDGTFPAVGVGGGTGVAPLVAMLRHARATGTTDLLKLAVSSRTWAELPYAAELADAAAVIALSRQDSVAGRVAGRLSTADLATALTTDATYYVCGSTGFTEAASTLLMALQVPAETVRSSASALAHEGSSETPWPRLSASGANATKGSTITSGPRGQQHNAHHSSGFVSRCRAAATRSVSSHSAWRRASVTASRAGPAARQMLGKLKKPCGLSGYSMC
ncbi:MAG TPA: FAD-binding oxidoreductase [Propionibacteriaceae bacterium]